MSLGDALNPKTDFEADDLPNGPAFAAVIAAAFGSFVLGVFTTLAELSAGIKDWLNWRDPVGPLSGKTGIAVVAWVGAWLALGLLWRRRDIDARRAVVVTAIFVGLGVLGTFPSFFERFAAN